MRRTFRRGYRFPKRFKRAVKRIYRKRFYKRVAGCIRKFAEKKYINGYFSHAPTYSVPIVADLSSIAGGTTKNTRIGQHVQPGILHFRWNAVNSHAITASEVRFMIVQVMNNTSYPSLADILLYSGTATSTVSPYNRDAYIKYKVLYDKVITLDYYNISKSGRFNLKIKKGIEWFSPNSGDFVNGSLWLLITSDVNSDPPAVKSAYSFTFTDV